MSRTEWAADGRWHRPDPAAAIQVREWMDPCPECGSQVTGLDAEAITVRDNPQAVISIRNPACPYDPADLGSPDCICQAVINPAPDPLPDEEHVAGMICTLRPCGHQARRVRLYRETRPEPGTPGALIAGQADS